MTASQCLEVFVSYSVQVLVVVFFGRRLERRVLTSEDRCLVWNTCFFSTLVLGFASLMLPRFHLIQPWLSLDYDKLITISSMQGVIGRLIVIVWATGAAVSIVKLIAREIFLRTTLGRCHKLDEDEVRRLLHGLTKFTVTKPLPTILISDENFGPCCWQLHRPTILLPNFIVEGCQDDLRHVLIHELEHLQTKHPLHLFLQQLAQVVCWFHPAIWTAACHASLAREYVCDDAAADYGNGITAYLRTLLRIAERQCDANQKLQNMGFSRSRSEIVLRARRLAHYLTCGRDRRRPRIVQKRTIVCTILLMTFILSQVWLPFDSMSSSRSRWSPWPTWTSQAGHFFGLNLRDYEEFDRRSRSYEIRCENGAI